MEAIINKQAYWGLHTFRATLDTTNVEEPSIRLEVYRNLSKKHEGTYFFKNKEELLKLAADKDCALRFYVGEFFGTQLSRVKKEVTRKLKSGRIVTEMVDDYIPTIDSFIAAFRYEITE